MNLARAVICSAVRIPIMRRLKPGLSITRAAALLLLACAARLAPCQGDGETLTIMLPGGVPLEMVHVQDLDRSLQERQLGERRS